MNHIAKGYGAAQEFATVRLVNPIDVNEIAAASLI